MAASLFQRNHSIQQIRRTPNCRQVKCSHSHRCLCNSTAVFENEENEAKAHSIAVVVAVDENSEAQHSLPACVIYEAKQGVARLIQKVALCVCVSADADAASLIVSVWRSAPEWHIGSKMVVVEAHLKTTSSMSVDSSDSQETALWEQMSKYSQSNTTSEPTFIACKKHQFCKLQTVPKLAHWPTDWLHSQFSGISRVAESVYFEYFYFSSFSWAFSKSQNCRINWQH